MCCRTRIRTATFCLNDLVLPLHHTAYKRMGGTQVNVLFTADLQPPCGFQFLSYIRFVFYLQAIRGLPAAWGKSAPLCLRSFRLPFMSVP